MAHVFRLTIETGNAAFVDDASELGRIIRRVADHIDGGADAGMVADSNGNTVGSFSLAAKS